MYSHVTTKEAVSQKFAHFERAAPAALPALLACAAMSFFIHAPASVLIASAVGAGVSVFFSWRCALREQGHATAAFVFAALALSLFGVALSPHLTVAALLLQGLGVMGSVFFLLLLVARNRKSG
ncbi:hypothetical protein [Roseateles paludis]|jgi:hypothetical protein|uniref:Uncharacterized protein n=1 Tax=Roseateles paludis TaxID=3145238 RepID=A0ABV0FYG6_9BURK